MSSISLTKLSKRVGVGVAGIAVAGAIAGVGITSYQDNQAIKKLESEQHIMKAPVTVVVTATPSATIAPTKVLLYHYTKVPTKVPVK